jgi:site-specific DNA-methyltransferase (adenine-specific)
MENIGNAKLFKGDCLEIMPTLEAGSVDLVFADLPYGVTACDWDVIIPFDRLWAEYERVLKPAGSVILTASQPFTTKLINSKMDWFRYELIWKKNTVTGHLNSKYQPMRGHENILVFSPVKTTKMTYRPQGLVAVDKKKRTGRSRIYNKQNTEMRHVRWTNFPRSVLEFASETVHLHPTQKPVALLAYLIETYSEPGAVVLDNTMGVGSTGVAALQVGRQFIGIEMAEKFYRVAVERHQNVCAQTF